jgi:nicotinamidase-related amidase
MRNLDSIDHIIVAMDSHYPTHIAHAIFWKRGKNHPNFTEGRSVHPDPFTVITYKEIMEEIWAPVQKDQFLVDWVKYYTRELEKKGRLQLTVWPEHCIIGSNGHAVVAPINEAVQAWAKNSQKTVRYVQKGQNLYTEMYSVLVAEVEDPTDPATGNIYSINIIWLCIDEYRCNKSISVLSII